jgi:uncharacterized protein YbjQ (UPF0145 family)
MAIQSIDRNSREYITKNPMRSSIGAVGFGAVQSVNLAVDVIEVSRDVVKLAKFSLKESLIEAETEALKAELVGASELAELRLELENKKAQLASA